MENNEHNYSGRLINIFKKVLPSPFTIAILLSIITLVMAQLLTRPADTSHVNYFVEMLSAWETGLWDSSAGGLYFAFQMMLILVLGHILALSPAVDRLIQLLMRYCTNSASAALIVSLGAMSMGLINWGLGLIFGAIMARKIGEKFAKENKKLNYALVGAAGYTTMMTWHAGLSGSATTKSMEEGYISSMMTRMNIPGDYSAMIPFEATIGSGMNIIVILLSLTVIPFVLYQIGKRKKNETVPYYLLEDEKELKEEELVKEGAERLDHHPLFGMILGIGFLIFALYQAISYQGESSLGFIQLNFINFVFLGLSLLLHKSIYNFSRALDQAIGDISGILIQFPFYFGILAIMNNSGLIIVFSDAITSIANQHTLPFLIFISAGVVNFFVPSGGGQWAIQGPIIIETAQQLGADLPKNILAMAYGDQWTNMLQPFWALPLLGITKLKPQQLLAYSFIVFLLGLLIFGLVLLVA